MIVNLERILNDNQQIVNLKWPKYSQEIRYLLRILKLMNNFINKLSLSFPPRKCIFFEWGTLMEEKTPLDSGINPMQELPRLDT